MAIRNNGFMTDVIKSICAKKFEDDTTTETAL